MTNWTFETRIDKRGAVWQMKDKPVYSTWSNCAYTD